MYVLQGSSSSQTRLAVGFPSNLIVVGKNRPLRIHIKNCKNVN